MPVNAAAFFQKPTRRAYPHNGNIWSADGLLFEFLEFEIGFVNDVFNIVERIVGDLAGIVVVAERAVDFRVYGIVRLVHDKLHELVVAVELVDSRQDLVEVGLVKADDIPGPHADDIQILVEENLHIDLLFVVAVDADVDLLVLVLFNTDDRVLALFPVQDLQEGFGGGILRADGEGGNAQAQEDAEDQEEGEKLFACFHVVISFFPARRAVFHFFGKRFTCRSRVR